MGNEVTNPQRRVRRRFTARRGPVPVRTSSPKSYKIIAVSLYSDQADALDEAVRELASAGYPKASRSLIVQAAVSDSAKTLVAERRKGYCATSVSDICADR